MTSAGLQQGQQVPLSEVFELLSWFEIRFERVLVLYEPRLSSVREKDGRGHGYAA